MVNGWVPCLNLGLHSFGAKTNGGERQGKMLREDERPRLALLRRIDRYGALPVGASVCHDGMAKRSPVLILCSGAWKPPCQRFPRQDRHAVGVGVGVAGPVGMAADGAVGVGGTVCVGVSSAAWVGTGVSVGDGVAVGVRVIGVPI